MGFTTILKSQKKSLNALFNFTCTYINVYIDISTIYLNVHVDMNIYIKHIQR